MTNPITINSGKTITSILRGGTSIEKMMLAWEWRPQALFLGNEQAASYDPIDTANEDWRRNFIINSEDLTNSSWLWIGGQKTNVVPNLEVAPDGSMTADLIYGDVGKFTALGPNISVPYVTGEAWTYSIYAKKQPGSPFGSMRVNLDRSGSSGCVIVNLSDGSIFHQDNGDGSAAAVVDAGNGWYRISHTRNSVAASGSWFSNSVRFFAQKTFLVGENLSNGDGLSTSGVYVWGAQLERGSVATPYQRITDVNTEVRALFPNNTMFQDSASTTLVSSASATTSQTVGSWLDKSKLLAPGPEFVVNGTFGTDLTNWNRGVGAAIERSTTIFPDGGLLVTANGAVQSYATQLVTGLTIGRRYLLSASLYTPSTNAINNRATIGIQSSSFTAAGSRAQASLNVVETISINFTATSTSQTIYMSVVTSDFASFGGATSSGHFDNISVRDIAGNHALQTSTSLRPLFGRAPVSGRRNLLTYTEQFASPWVLTGSTFATSTIAGFLTAVAFGNNSIQRLLRNPAQQTAGLVYTTSAYVEMDDGLAPVVGAASNTGDFSLVNDDAIATSPVVTRLGTTNVYRVSATRTCTVTGARQTGIYKYTTQSARSFKVTGLQLELGSVATPYQKVVSALDVTEAGKPSYAFMRPDLSDDKLTTNMASTKNLFKYSQEFDDNFWKAFSAVNVTPNSMIAPDGTLTADTIAAIFANSNNGAFQNTVAIPNGSSVSFYAKRGTVGWVAVGTAFTAFTAWFNLDTGTTGSSTNCTASMINAGNGWWRCSLNNITVGASRMVISPKQAGGTGDSWSVGVSAIGDSIYLWGAQLELSATVTAYEHSGFKGDILVAGKNGSVLQSDVVSPTGVMDLGPLTYTGGDTANILRAVGDIVGYTMVRKKLSDAEKGQLVRYYKKRGAKGLLVSAGPELIVNGGFTSNLSGWVDAYAITEPANAYYWDNGVAKSQFAAGGRNSRILYQDITTVVGRSYRATWKMLTTSVASLTGIGNALGALEYAGVFVATTTTTRVSCSLNGTQIAEIDQVSVVELRPEEEW